MNRYFIDTLTECSENNKKECSDDNKNREDNPPEFSELVKLAEKITPPDEKKKDGDEDEESNSVPKAIIDFDYFLLHALRINSLIKGDERIPITANNLKLLSYFNSQLDRSSKEDSVLDFFRLLIKLRLLF